ncbi:MAG TPA: T9SS type A sorting domain-containing protein [Saprospiraceae bacterium]|nr:T9SS type A sorting domain-containing protein [Saprospiraceae bacterium]
MKNFTLSFLFSLIAVSGFCTTWTIVNSGFTFNPPTLTIVEGDDVMFNLDAIHNSVEVSQATWNMNGNTPLSGGWATGFGGGFVPASMLEVGTHFYVCQPHAGDGMKGVIIVQQSTGTNDNLYRPSFSIYPNPSTGRINMVMENAPFAKNNKLEVYDLQGNQVYATDNIGQEVTQIEIELSGMAKGVYIIRYYDDKGLRSRKLILQ